MSQCQSPLRSPLSSRRRKTGDYIGTHEVDLFPRPITKRFRVRTYDSEDKLPVVVISAFEDPVHAITPDLELIAAETVLREFPKRALRARKRKKFVHVVEHLPKNYDITHTRPERIDQFDLVEFNDYRIRIAGLRRRRRVRNVEKALRENTIAGHDRLIFGYPRWRNTSKEEVEEMIGMTLDDTIDVSLRSLPSDLPDARHGAGDVAG